MKSNLCDKSENNGHLDTGQLRLELSRQFLMWVFKFTGKVRVYYKYVPATRVSQRKLLESQETTSTRHSSGVPFSQKHQKSLSARSIRSPCLARSTRSSFQPEASEVPVNQKHQESLSDRSIRSPCLARSIRSPFQSEASGVHLTWTHHESLSARGSSSSPCQSEAS
jgi:hypothetical protein